MKKIGTFILVINIIFTTIAFNKETLLANGNVTYVYIQPREQTINMLGENFAVNVNVKYALDLYGYEFKLYYNSTVLKGINVTEGPFLKQKGQTFFYIVSFNDNYNSTHGILWIDSCLVGNTFGADGEGTLTTIIFKSIKPGYTLISLDSVELVDSRKNPIQHQVIDGTVTIIPEFTTTFQILTLFITAVIICLIHLLHHKRKRELKAKNKSISNKSQHAPRPVSIKIKDFTYRIIKLRLACLLG